MLDERHLLVEFRRPQTRHGLGVPVGNDLALDGLTGILRALDLCGGGLIVILVLPGDRRPELADSLAHRAPQLRQALRPEDHQGDDEDDDQLEWSNIWHPEAWYSREGPGKLKTGTLRAALHRAPDKAASAGDTLPRMIL